MENKPHYALFVEAENDYVTNMKLMSLKIVKIDSHEIDQENNVITILPSREELGNKRSYVYTENVKGMEDTYNMPPTETNPYTPLSLLLISKETTPYDILAKLYSYTTIHTDNYYSALAQEILKGTSKNLRKTLRQVFSNDNVNEAFINVCITTKTITTYIKHVGALYYQTVIGPTRIQE